MFDGDTVNKNFPLRKIWRQTIFDQDRSLRQSPRQSPRHRYT